MPGCWHCQCLCWSTLLAHGSRTPRQRQAGSWKRSTGTSHTSFCLWASCRVRWVMVACKPQQYSAQALSITNGVRAFGMRGLVQHKTCPPVCAALCCHATNATGRYFANGCISWLSTCCQQVNGEVKTLNDIIFVDQSTNYSTILIKTLFVFQYAVWHYNANFIIKTDDDAFINVPATINMLKVLPLTECVLSPTHQPTTRTCAQPPRARMSGCTLELWPVEAWCTWTQSTAGTTWSFTTTQALKSARKGYHDAHAACPCYRYPNYMMGGGYIVSGDVASALVSLHAQVGLKFTPIEDATFGFWLSAMDLRQVDHPKIYAWGNPCCFRRILRFKACTCGNKLVGPCTPPHSQQAAWQTAASCTAMVPQRLV